MRALVGTRAARSSGRTTSGRLGARIRAPCPPDKGFVYVCTPATPGGSGRVCLALPFLVEPLFILLHPCSPSHPSAQRDALLRSFVPSPYDLVLIAHSFISKCRRPAGEGRVAARGRSDIVASKCQAFAFSCVIALLGPSGTLSERK